MYIDVITWNYFCLSHFDQKILNYASPYFSCKSLKHKILPLFCHLQDNVKNNLKKVNKESARKKSGRK